MKVLHLDEQPGWRGGEQQASWLLQGLARQGHSVLIAGRPGSRFLTSGHGGAELQRLALPFRGEWDLVTAVRLASALKTRSIDILHAHTSHVHTTALLARFLAGRGKVIVSRRVSFPPKRNPLNRWKYRLPDRIIAVSQEVGRVLRDSGLDEDRIAVVHSAVDLARLDVPPMPRSDLGVPQGVPLLVSAGALVGHKDHANLLAALPQVHTAFPEARLLIAGEGEQRPKIEAQIAALDLQGRVTLLGHRGDAPRLIRAGDVYVSSSWSEGLGTSILEALACRTPVVATEAGGAAEMIRPGQTGFLVPCRNADALAQAIIQCLSRREEARAMAERGRRLVQEEFVTDRMVAGTLRIYQEVLES